MARQTIVWTSSKTNAGNATKQLLKEQTKMAEKGYSLTSQDIVEQGRSKKTWILLGLLNFVRGKQVQMVATFTKDEQLTPTS